MTAVELEPVLLPRRPSALRRIRGNPKVVTGVVMLLPVVVSAVVGSVLSPYDPSEQGVGPALTGPSRANWFGTDLYGRDYLSRMIEGAAVVVSTSSVVVGVSAAVGVLAGLVAGFKRGLLDAFVMTGVDILLSFPWILTAVGLVAVLGPGLRTVMVALVIAYVPQIARLTRNAVIAVESKDFVHAGVAIGESQTALMFRYVLRNAYRPILVLVTSMLAFASLNEAAISYLGYGVQSPDTSWGLELAVSSQFLTVGPHLAVFPGLLLAWYVLGLNLLGDGLGDVFSEMDSE